MLFFPVALHWQNNSGDIFFLEGWERDGRVSENYFFFYLNQVFYLNWRTYLNLKLPPETSYFKRKKTSVLACVWLVWFTRMIIFFPTSLNNTTWVHLHLWVVLSTYQFLFTFLWKKIKVWMYSFWFSSS